MLGLTFFSMSVAKMEDTADETEKEAEEVDEDGVMTGEAEEG